MSESIELLEPEGFVPNKLRPANVTFKSRKARRINKKTLEIYRNAHKRTVAGSVENIVTDKSRRLCNDFNISLRSSMRLNDGQGPSRVSSRSNEGLSKDKKSFPSLQERLEVRKDWQLFIDTDDPQYFTFLKYGIRRECSEWSLPGSFVGI